VDIGLGGLENPQGDSKWFGLNPMNLRGAVTAWNHSDKRIEIHPNHRAKWRTIPVTVT